MQMQVSVLHGIGRRRIIPATIITRGTFISVTATWTAIASTIVVVFVVSQASNRTVVGQLYQSIAKQPRRIIGAVQPELNHFAVQMVSQSQ